MFAKIQSGDCAGVFGASPDLKSVITKFDTGKIAYDLSPTWFQSSDLEARPNRILKDEKEVEAKLAEERQRRFGWRKGVFTAIGTSAIYPMSIFIIEDDRLWIANPSDRKQQEYSRSAQKKEPDDYQNFGDATIWWREPLFRMQVGIFSDNDATAYVRLGEHHGEYNECYVTNYSNLENFMKIKKGAVIISESEICFSDQAKKIRLQMGWANALPIVDKIPLRDQGCLSIDSQHGLCISEDFRNNPKVDILSQVK